MVMSLRHGEQRERTHTPLKSLLQKLAICGVKKIVIEFDGEEDSGSTSGITYTPELDISEELKERVSEEAWNIVCSYYGGFYNNEGGYGNLTFDMTKKNPRCMIKYIQRNYSNKEEEPKWDSEPEYQRHRLG